MSIKQLTKVFDLDKLSDPSFEISVRGTSYKAKLNSFGDLRRFAEFTERLEGELKEQKLTLDSNAGIAAQVSYLFEIDKSIIDDMHFSKVSAIFRGVQQFAQDCFSASFETLQNFNQGEAQEAANR